MATPLLTIAIPTYERASRLRDCLDSILKQCDGSVGAQIEIVVSDNGSTDGTAPMLLEYASTRGVRVRRNPTNIGMDLNLIEATRMATGEFIWWMGDDDRIHEGFLAYACKLLTTGTSDFYFVPCAPIAGRPDCMGTVHYLGYERPVTANLWEFVNQHGFFRILGSIGHCMFRRKLLVDYSNEVPHAPCFAHAFALLFSFADSPATLLTRNGFEVPEKTSAEMNEYVVRWKKHNLWNWGWFRCAQLLYEIVAGHHLPFPKATFFQMFAGQDFAFQFHAIQSVLTLTFQDGETVSAKDIERLTELTRWLDLPAYDALCRNACELIKAHHTLCATAKQISSAPIAAFPPLPMEGIRLRA
jgi:glycosyltransferase involved in cell wall biosynthesis